jgi:HEAT repeat protein
MKYVFDAPYSIRYQAVDMLGSLAVQEAVPVLENLLATSGDGDLRIAAANALANIRSAGGSL